MVSACSPMIPVGYMCALQEDKMEELFKKQHPDFQDDDDLNEETPVLPKVVQKKKTILSKQFWPLWLTFGISLLGATVMAVRETLFCSIKRCQSNHLHLHPQAVNYHITQQKKKGHEMTQASEAFGIGELDDDVVNPEDNPASAAHADVVQEGEEKKSLL